MKTSMDEDSASDVERSLLTLELILLDLTWIRTPKIDTDHVLIPTVCFKVLDFPLVMFSPQRGQAPLKASNIAYNQGKSCVFNTNLSVLCEQFRTYPIYSFLMDTGQQPAPMVAFGAFPLQAVLEDVQRFSEDHSGWPTISAQHGEAYLRNTRGKRVAWISFALRLSCLSDAEGGCGVTVPLPPTATAPAPTPTPIPALDLHREAHGHGEASVEQYASSPLPAAVSPVFVRPPVLAAWPAAETCRRSPPLAVQWSAGAGEDTHLPAAAKAEQHDRAALEKKLHHQHHYDRDHQEQQRWAVPRTSPRQAGSQSCSSLGAGGGDSCWRAPLEPDDSDGSEASSGPIVTRLIQELAAMQRAAAESRDAAVQTRPMPQLHAGRVRSAKPRRPRPRHPAGLRPLSVISEEPVTEGFSRRRVTSGAAAATARPPVDTSTVDRLTRGQPVTSTRHDSGGGGRVQVPRLRPVALTRTAQLRLAQHMPDVRHDLKAEEYVRRRDRWLLEQRRRLGVAGRRKQETAAAAGRRKQETAAAAGRRKQEAAAVATNRLTPRSAGGSSALAPGVTRQRQRQRQARPMSAKSVGVQHSDPGSATASRRSQSAEQVPASAAAAVAEAAAAAVKPPSRAPSLDSLSPPSSYSEPRLAVTSQPSSATERHSSSEHQQKVAVVLSLEKDCGGPPEKVPATSGGNGGGSDGDQQSTMLPPLTPAQRSASAPAPALSRAETAATPHLSRASTSAHSPPLKSDGQAAKQPPPPSTRREPTSQSKVSFVSRSSSSSSSRSASRRKQRPAAAAATTTATTATTMTTNRSDSTDVSTRYSCDQLDDESASNTGHSGADKQTSSSSKRTSVRSGGRRRRQVRAASSSGDTAPSPAPMQDRLVSEEMVSHSRAAPTTDSSATSTPASEVAEQVTSGAPTSETTSPPTESVQEEAPTAATKTSSNGSSSFSSSSSTGEETTVSGSTLQESRSKRASSMKRPSPAEAKPSLSKMSDKKESVLTPRSPAKSKRSNRNADGDVTSRKVKPVDKPAAADSTSARSPRRRAADAAGTNTARISPGTRRDSAAGRTRSRAPALSRAEAGSDGQQRSRSASRDSAEIEARIAMYLEQSQLKQTQQRETDRRRQREQEAAAAQPPEPPPAGGGWLRSAAPAAAAVTAGTSWLKEWRVDDDDVEPSVGRRLGRSRHTVTRQSTGVDLNTDSVSSYVPSDADGVTLSELSVA